MTDFHWAPVPDGVIFLFLERGYAVSTRSDWYQRQKHLFPGLLITDANCQHIIMSIMPGKVFQSNDFLKLLHTDVSKIWNDCM